MDYEICLFQQAFVNNKQIKQETYSFFRLHLTPDIISHEISAIHFYIDHSAKRD